MPTATPPGGSVANRLTKLLQRCDQLKRASDMTPTLFDHDGEAAARAIAAADAECTDFVIPGLFVTTSAAEHQ
jgi:hypothetical protein